MQGQGYQSDRVADLVGQIMRHKDLYYAGKPEISDARYDALEAELQKLAPSHPVLQMVGAGKTESTARKVEHATPMLSLDKTYDLEDLTAWFLGREVVGTLKIDGNSLSLVYQKGRLALAKTRGNGRVGEDVTDKARWVSDIVPELKIKALPPTVEIRGELFCTESNFLRLSDDLVKLGIERPTSPRNIVAGLLGRKLHFELSRYFGFFAFDVVEARALGLKTEEAKLTWLEAAGFRMPHHRLLKDAEGAREYLEYVKKLSAEDEIGLDGAVFTFNDLSLHDQLGATAHHPRYKLSFKWEGTTAVSVIKDITWATSRLGFVTPVAVIEPVFLSGAQITNVTLHNAAHVKAYNLKVGDRIEIIRSGEVIPKFLSVVEAGQGCYAWPKTCPECGTPLVFGEVKLQCPNAASCPAQQLRTILNWLRCAEIDDLSEKRLLPLIELGLVKSMADLYLLRVEDFLKIPLTKEKMAAKLFANIDASRKLPLARFLNGLGIEGAGFATWEAIVEHHPTLAQVRKITPEDLVAIEGFAEKSAKQIVEGLSQKSWLIDALLAAGVRPTEVDAKILEARQQGPLSGKQIVLTGALSRPRDEIEKDIRAAGGHPTSSVSKNTYAVVTEDPTSTSSKMKKARDLGVKVWSEEDLRHALHKHN